IINIFGVTGSTIGKLFIVVHRFVVIRRTTLIEDVWSNRINCILTFILLVLSCARCVSIFFCGYAIIVRDGVRLVTFIDNECNVADKTQSSVINLIYIIYSVVLTVLTSRQLINIRRNAEVRAQTQKFIMTQQRNMFIIVSACTVSHLIKAMHQFCWIFAAYFRLPSLNAILINTYAYPHYLATYSASLTLVIFSPRVRRLLMTFRNV
ncbi:hypothetical protein PFISCL1PPCAC_12910, partial [Pristionchus fissidentatus]